MRAILQGSGGSSRLRRRRPTGSAEGGSNDDGQARRGRPGGGRCRHDRRLGLGLRARSGRRARRRARSRARRPRRLGPRGRHGARTGRLARHGAPRRVVDRVLRRSGRALRHRFRIRRAWVRDPRCLGGRRAQPRHERIAMQRATGPRRSVGRRRRGPAADPGDGRRRPASAAARTWPPTDGSIHRGTCARTRSRCSAPASSCASA